MPRDRLLLTAFLLSGAAALGYELLWTRLLALSLGSETLGVLAALAGFFGGLALGSFALHRPILRSSNPVALFAVLETIAAVYAGFSPGFLYWLAREIPPLLGTVSSGNDNFTALALSLAVAVAVLLPATFCMGATLAALTEARRRSFPEESPGRGMGRLYAANTLGATVGALATVYWLLPRLGLGWGAVALSAAGLTSAGLALLWNRSPKLRRAPSSSVPAAESVRPESRDAVVWLHFLLFATGLAGVGLEVVGIQILAQNMQNTVYTFVNVLAVYLLGTSLGAWLYSIRSAFAKASSFAKASADEVRQTETRETATLLLIQAIVVVLAAFPLRWNQAVLEAFGGGSGYGWRLAGEFAAAALVFGPPTVVMGAVFSHIAGRLARGGVGRAYALNTLGSTLAPFVFGIGALNWLGYAAAFRFTVAAYLALFVAFSWARGISLRFRVGGAVAVLLLAVAAPRSMQLIDPPPNWRPVFQEASLMGLVMVTEQKTGAAPGLHPERRLQVNRHFRMGGAASFGEQRMGHIPLLLAGGARKALFLGLGTGATLGTVRDYPLDQVEAVELVPGVLRAMRFFPDVNRLVWTDARVRFHTADARRFVAATPDRFDLVVADLFHPARDGAGSLFAHEHFQAIRQRLEPGGIFVQWVPLYQFDSSNFKTLARTFLDVFPQVHSFLGLYNAETPAFALVGLEAAAGDWKLDLDALETKLAEPAYQGLLLQDARELAASYMLDRPALERFAGAGPLNTDLNPRILFDAPRTVYEKAADLRWGVLQELLPLRTGFPSELAKGSDPRRLNEFLAEAKAFSAALTFYLQAEIARVSRLGEGVVAPEAIELYLAAYNQAPDFMPAAGVLYFLASKDPRAGAAIFGRMLQREPDRERTWRELLKYLEGLGDEARLERFREQARIRFGDQDWNR